MGDAGRWVSQSEPGGGDQTEIPALLRALSRARGFALYFVECTDAAYCQRKADALCERLDRPVVDVNLGDVERGSTRPTIDFVLERRLAGVPDEAVAFVWGFEKLFGGRSVACDFVDLVQNGFCTRPVAPLQGLV